MALKLTGELEISLEELKPLIDKFVQERYGAPVSRLEFRKGKLLAHIDHALNEQVVKPLTTPRAEKPFKTSRTDTKKSKPKTFHHKWIGLYHSVAQIIENQRKRKRKFISFEDLMAELLELKDLGGNKLFVKPDGEILPMSVLKQRMSTSQIVRQVKTQPNLKGVIYHRTGLKL